jgi:integrase
LQWAEGRWLLGEGKAAGSRRVVNLPQSLVSLLATHRRQQQALRAGMSEWHDYDLVFCDEHGEPFNPHGFESSWRHICHKAGLEGVRFHDLRHTHATELLRAGVHPKIVSERLGHASVTMTLDRYSHAVPDLQSEAAEKTDALLRGLLGTD